MMLTPEQLAELREKLERDYLCWRNPDVRRLFEHIDAQQVRIAELEAQLNRIKALADCATVQTWLELPDADKARWFAVTGQRDSYHCKRIRDLETALRDLKEHTEGICDGNYSYEMDTAFAAARAVLAECDKEGGKDAGA